jgi:hypothetical protein
MLRPSELLLLAVLALIGCRPRERGADAPPKRLSAEQEVLAVATVWQALEEEHGARGPNHRIAVFDLKQRTTLTLREGQRIAEEKIEIKERFELKNGGVFECRARGLARVQVRFGRKAGEPALEVQRPSMLLPRTCAPSDFPERELQLSGGTSRFLLQDERLIGFAPPGERRVFLPQQ